MFVLMAHSCAVNVSDYMVMAFLYVTDLSLNSLSLSHKQAISTSTHLTPAHWYTDHSYPWQQDTVLTLVPPTSSPAALPEAPGAAWGSCHTSTLSLHPFPTPHRPAPSPATTPTLRFPPDRTYPIRWCSRCLPRLWGTPLPWLRRWAGQLGCRTLNSSNPQVPQCQQPQLPSPIVNRFPRQRRGRRRPPSSHHSRPLPHPRAGTPPITRNHPTPFST